MIFEDVTINDLADLCAFFGVHRASELNEAVHARTAHTCSYGASVSLRYEDGAQLDYGFYCGWEHVALGPEDDPLKVTSNRNREDITWGNPGNPTEFSLQACVFDSDATVETHMLMFGKVTAGWLLHWMEEIPSAIEEIMRNDGPFEEEDPPF